jgi:hypothetical protein
LNQNLFKINLGTSGFVLEVTHDETEEGFISSFHGQFVKEGVETVYPTLYWQIVNVSLGIKRIGNISFAFDIDGSTEPFTSLYDVSESAYREQVAVAMDVEPSDISHDLLVINGLDSKGAESVDESVIASAIKKIESIQCHDVGLTGYFTDTDDKQSQDFVSFLTNDGFQKLSYDGFVSKKALMLFRPQIYVLDN